MKKWKVYALWILLCETVGALSGFLSREGIALYQAGPKPAISLPGMVFGIVWGVLFTLMGISAAQVTLENSSVSRSRGLNLMVVQLAVNFCWPLLFFNLRAYAFSLVWLLILLGLVVWMVIQFYRVKKSAAFLQLPYILWLCFAAILNDQVMKMG